MLGSTGARRLGVTQCLSGRLVGRAGGGERRAVTGSSEKSFPPPGGRLWPARPREAQAEALGDGLGQGCGQGPADAPCLHSRRPSPILTLFFAFCCSTVSLSSVASFSRHHTCDSSSMRLGTDSRSLSGSQGLQPHRACLGAPPCPRRPGAHTGSGTRVRPLPHKAQVSEVPGQLPRPLPREPRGH